MVGVNNFEYNDRCVAVAAMRSVVQTTASTEWWILCQSEYPSPWGTPNVFYRFDKHKHSLQIKQEDYNEHYNTLLLLLFKLNIH
jgi:hypothetical protein